MVAGVGVGLGVYVLVPAPVWRSKNNLEEEEEGLSFPRDQSSSGPQAQLLLASSLKSLLVLLEGFQFC